MNLQESGEMYLETILILSEKSDQVRSIDIAEYLNYSKPSVSRAVNLLKGGAFITVSEEGYIVLTESGLSLAKKIYERHRVLSEYLVCLGVDRDTATADACKIEHDISDRSFEAIKRSLMQQKRDLS